MAQHAMQSCQPPRLRLAGGVDHGMGPAFQRGDVRRNQYGAACRLRQYAGKILTGAVIGDEHRQPGQVGQAVSVLVEQSVGDGVRQRRAAQGFQADQRSRY